MELLEPRDDRPLRGGVDRGRVVAADAGSEDRLALDPRRQLVEHGADVLRGGPAELEPGRHAGWKSRPESSLGKKYVVFCGSVSPASAKRKTSSIRVGRTMNAPAARPLSTAATASSTEGVYDTPS